MKIGIISLVFSTLIAFFTPAAFAVDDEYIRVEIKGRLETGLMAIGGETTGAVIRARNVTWELNFGSSKELQDRAGKLHKKTIIVTGTYRKITGAEIRERHIVDVATLKVAGEQ